MNGPYQHIPILKEEITELLVENPEGVYVDGTLGGGGHTEAILQRLSDKGRIIGIDKDQDALEACCERFQNYSGRIQYIHGDFMQMTALIKKTGINQVDGILLDLGVSSHQIDSPDRGFSYIQSGPLDMRMNVSEPVSAYELVNKTDLPELERIFRQYGEERLARPIARAIGRGRERAPIRSTGDLVSLIKPIVKHRPLYKTCARVFQALRIAVNSEIDPLGQGLADAVDLLRVGGRLGVITYHSLEDRIVKHTFKDLARTCVCPPGIPQCVCNNEAKIRIITRKPVYPSDEEIRSNPRARSAKLRFVERLSVSSPGLNAAN